MKKLPFLIRKFCIIAIVLTLSCCKQEEEKTEPPMNSFRFISQIIIRPPIGINLEWSEVSNADEYILYRSINTLDNYTDIISTILNSYTDTDVS
jgi:hypothetical protein